jgi:uncharacterized protein YuzE
MRISYYPDEDMLYISLNNRASADSEEVVDGVVVDYDDEGRVVGIEIEHASTKVDLTTLEAESLPVIR